MLNPNSRNLNYQIYIFKNLLVNLTSSESSLTNVKPTQLTQCKYTCIKSSGVNYCKKLLVYFDLIYYTDILIYLSNIKNMPIIMSKKSIEYQWIYIIDIDTDMSGMTYCEVRPAK